jgi:ribosomal protein L21E
VNELELKRKKQRERMQEYWKNNPMKYREFLNKQNQKYNTNPIFAQKKRDDTIKWKNKHPIKTKRANKEYREKHKEEIKEYLKDYREGDKREELLEKKRLDYIKNKERYNKLAKKNYLKNREDIIKQTSDYYYKTVKPIKIEVFKHYSKGEPKCSCCGETGIIEFLTIEHVDGRNKDEKRRSGHGLYRWLKSQNYPKGCEVQCWNCNCSDGFFGICSHKKQYEFPNTSEGRYKKSCIEHYSKGKMICECCNESNIGFLTIDHIESNGSKHKREIKKSKIFKWLSDNNFPEGFRILCFNCNSGRNLTENKVCPHTLNFK